MTRRQTTKLFPVSVVLGCCVAVLSASFSVVAHAATIRVPTDQTTIQNAINAASANDVIVVENSATYTENPTIGGGTASPLTIRATATPPATVNGYFSCSGDNKVTILEGFTMSGGTYNLLLKADGLTVTCTNMRMKNATSDGVRFDDLKTNCKLNMDACIVESAGSGYGVHFSVAANSRANLKNCVFYNEDRGIYVESANNSIVTAVNCTFANNYGIMMMAGTAPWAYVTNCIMYQGTYGIILGVGTCVGDYNLYYGQSATAVNGTTLGSHDITGQNPSFTNAVAHDYRLLSGSPAINSGLDLSSTILTDGDGNERPAGAGFDRGAFEFGSTKPRQDGVVISVY